MWVPSACATAALIVSACETHTIVPPGWASAEPVERGDHAGLHLGEALAVREPERRRRALHGAPLGQLHQVLQFLAGPVAEVALEQAAVDLWAASRGPWRSAPPSPSPARAASCRRRRCVRARRSAPRRWPACSWPSSARCRPLARPGSTLPVVGVCPWRTNRIVVAAGWVGFLADDACDRRSIVWRWPFSWWPWGDSNLLSGSVTRPRARARSRCGHVPCLSAPGRVA